MNRPGPSEFPKRFLSIRFKMLFLLAFTLALMVTVLSVRGYWLVYKMREQTVGESLRADAGLIAASIANMIDLQNEDLRAYFGDVEWKTLLQKSNEKYAGLSPDKVAEHFQSMDLKWADPSVTKESLDLFLDSRGNARLANYEKSKELVAELFLTDRSGGLVAASGRTTDFYQADEAWWQKAFDGGRGREIMEDVTWDPSSEHFGVDLALPIRDDQGAVAGVAKEVMDVGPLFSMLSGYHLGQTGHAVLVNAAGNILFHHAIQPMTVKFYNGPAFSKLIQDPKGCEILSDPHGHKGKMLVAYAPIESVLLKANGIRWYVFVDRSMNEVTIPLQRIAFMLAGTSAIVFFVFLWIGYLLSGKLTNPVRQLQVAITAVQHGQWNYHIDVHSGDEIQDLAESFNYTMEHLRDKQAELLKAKNEIEALSRDLEKKVEQRTREVEDARRATMNIMEDLVSANENLQKYTRELQKSQQEMEIQSWGLGKANEGIKELYKELEQKNAELAKLGHLKDDFVSIVAHELRNPLGVIREAAEFILDGLAGPVSEKQMQFIGMIKRTGDRLIHITTDLLDLAKIESGKITLNYETINFLSLVRQACEGIALRANKKGLTVSEDFPGGKLEISGDFEKLSQVMINLLSNAFKFTERGGIIAEVKDLGDEAQCAVRDTGPGIAPENLSRLFSKFEQFGKPTTSSEKGSGLGLVISKSIIEAHGGRIWAESELGKGTAVIFTVSKKPKRKQKLGEILVGEKIVTKEQVDEALRKQADPGL